MELESYLISAYGDKLGPKRLIVAGENDPKALEALDKARSRGWVEPMFCGNAFEDRFAGAEHVFHSLDLLEAREKAFELVCSEEAEALMYTGPLDQGFFKVLASAGREHKADRVLSYMSVFLTPRDGHLTFLTDTLINASPSLKHKIAILENVLSAARSLGIDEPLVAAVAPLELVNPAIPSTLDAAVLSKMSQRGQFGRAVIEGPLGMDNAESASAALNKGISSPVPGNADVYFFPDLESASITAQFLAWPGRCTLGGIVGGTDFPVILRSPLEKDDPWLANIILGAVL